MTLVVAREMSAEQRDFLVLRTDSVSSANGIRHFIAALRGVVEQCDLVTKHGEVEVHGQLLRLWILTPRAISTNAAITRYVNYLVKRQQLAGVLCVFVGVDPANGLARYQLFLSHKSAIQAALPRVSVPQPLAPLLDLGAPAAADDGAPLSAWHEFGDRLNGRLLQYSVAIYDLLRRTWYEQFNASPSPLLLGWLYSLTRLYFRISREPNRSADDELRARANEIAASAMRCVSFGRVRGHDPNGAEYLVKIVKDASARTVLDPVPADVSRQLPHHAPLERRLVAVLTEAVRATAAQAAAYCANFYLPWHAEQLARLRGEQCVLRIDIAVTHASARNAWRSPLALLTALRAALPLARDGVDYLLLWSSLVYDNLYARQKSVGATFVLHTKNEQRKLAELLRVDVPSSDTMALPALRYANRHVKRKVEELDTAHVLVVLGEPQRLALQVACASMLCVQRALGLVPPNGTAWPLASPLLAHTLAESDDLGSLCHALNALSAQLGLAADAWQARSPRAQNDALRTARLCVRLAALFAPTGAAAVAAMTDAIDSARPPERNSQQRAISREHGLAGALQVVLSGNLLPLTVPAELLRHLASLYGPEIDEQLSTLALYSAPAFALDIAKSEHEQRLADREQKKKETKTNKKKRRTANNEDDDDESEQSGYLIYGQRDGAAAAVVDCDCGGAGVSSCARLRAAHDQGAAIFGARCCLCDLERVFVDNHRAVLRECLCEHCCARAIGAQDVDSLPFADPDEWCDVARCDSKIDALAFIEAVVDEAEQEPETTSVSHEILLRMRSRLAAWTSIPIAPRFHKEIGPPWSAPLIDQLVRLVCTDTRDQMLDVLRQETPNPRRDLLLATHAALCDAAGDENDSAAGYQLGQCMTVLEITQTWVYLPVSMLSVLRCDIYRTAPRRAAAVRFMLPLESAREFSAYVTRQSREVSLFPLMPSAIAEHSVCGAGEQLSALNDGRTSLHARLARLLDPNLDERPCTGAPSNMLETLLVNWYR